MRTSIKAFACAGVALAGLIAGVAAAEGPPWISTIIGRLPAGRVRGASSQPCTTRVSENPANVMARSPIGIPDWRAVRPYRRHRPQTIPAFALARAGDGLKPHRRRAI